MVYVKDGKAFKVEKVYTDGRLLLYPEVIPMTISSTRGYIATHEELIEEGWGLWEE